MYRPTSFALFPLVVAGLLTAACDSELPSTPSEPPPTELTDTFSSTVTVNGAKTHPFTVTRAGSMTARLEALSVADTVVGLSLGTWNGEVCQLILTRDTAGINATVTGTASVGTFCVRIYDVGNLTGPVDYTVSVTHF